jgi:hypothetical protein
MGEMVIACYRPKPGKEADLLDLVRGHVPALREQGLATERPVTVLRASDGTLVEVFEWRSAEAVERAHHDPVVQRLWERSMLISDLGTLAALPGSGEPFPRFGTVDL